MMQRQRLVLTLDIATVTGWCLGRQGDNKAHAHGSIRFAKPGTSNGQVGRGAMKWLVDFVKVNQPDLITYEAVNAQHMQGKTTVKTIRVLIGLPFLFETILASMGYDDDRVLEAKTSDVRIFFIGKNMKRDPAKIATVARCHQLGYEPQDDNAADAIALWEYQMSLLRGVSRG